MSETEDEAAEKYVKVVFVGDCAVGKSSIVRRFCFNEYSRRYDNTSGADFYRKHIVLHQTKNIILKITDISGQEIKGSMLGNYLFNSDIVILVYDLTNTASFDMMTPWIKVLQSYVKFCPPITAIFGNKCDLEQQRTVKFDKLKEFLVDNVVQNYFVSARTGEKVVSSILEVVYKHLGLSVPINPNFQVSLPSFVKDKQLIMKDKKGKYLKSLPKISQSSLCLLQ